MSRVETVLQTLPELVDWPEPSPHLAARVAAIVGSRRPVIRVPQWRRWALVALAAATVVAGLIPGPRQAVANLLHEAGVRIGFLTDTPSLDAESLDLGRDVEFEEAAALVEFDPAAPIALGRPDAVFLSRDLQLTMVWEEDAVLLTQGSQGDLYAEKGTGPDTEVVPVSVGDSPGLWIEGADHSFTLLDPDGNRLEQTSRLAGNVLLWSADGVDYRLELREGMQRALEISTSLERTP
jgi:hypothetical protein